MIEKNDLEYVARVLEHYRYEKQKIDYELTMAIDYLRALIEEEFKNEE